MSTQHARQWLDKINAFTLPDTIKIMNVCGGHERALNQAGLRTLLPNNIELIPGPGCPVCICPEEAIAMTIEIAINQPVIVVTFGDMLRVPINAAKGKPRSLEQARALGADIRPIASPIEARALAQQHPEQTVVFFMAGFETTTAPTAAFIAEGIPDNLFLFLAARRTWPAVAQLLDCDTPGFNALIAPGHVSAVMGSDEWRFVAEQHQLPVAVAGFDAESLLAAIYSVIVQTLNHEAQLENCYPSVVKPAGNLIAQCLIDQTLDIVDSIWRGIGTIPASGYALNKDYSSHDANIHFAKYAVQSGHKREMPPGCDCASVVLGKCYPNQCRLYGTACTPSTPIGPCMVSDEGACRIWWANGLHKKSAVKQKQAVQA